MEFSVEQMCRTCLTSSTAMLSLFDSNISSGLNGSSSIADMLKSFTTVVISEQDGMPAKVCLSCISEINRAYSFKIKCENSEETLKQYLKQQQRTTLTQVVKSEHPTSAMLIEDTIIQDSEDMNVDDAILGEQVTEILHEDEAPGISEQHQQLMNTEIREEEEEEAHSFVISDFDSDDQLMDEKVILACQACCETFEKKEDFDAHAVRCMADEVLIESNGRRITTKKEKDPLQCPFCPVDFVHKKNLDKHVQKCHKLNFSDTPTKAETTEDTANINVEEPDENDTTPESKTQVKSEFDIIAEASILKHEPTVLPETNFQCNRCGAGFAKEKSLLYHVKINKCTAKQFLCNICKRVFISDRKLVNHMKTHEAKTFQCSKCTKKFSRQDQLKAHTMTAHDGVVKNQCMHCSKVFTMLSTLKDHLRTHSGEKPFLCSICGKGFTQNTNLQQHMMRHNKLKPFKCKQCDYSFVSKGELNAHTRKHTGDHPFVCKTCGSGFTTSSSLVKHIRIHTGERPYACEFCPMRFAALGTLKNHRRTHTGEQPFPCKYCDRSFAQKSDSVSHMRTHTGERPYICPICGLAFQQSGTMKTHMRLHEKPNEKVKKEEISSEILQVLV